VSLDFDGRNSEHAPDLERVQLASLYHLADCLGTAVPAHGKLITGIGTVGHVGLGSGFLSSFYYTVETVGSRSKTDVFLQ